MKTNKAAVSAMAISIFLLIILAKAQLSPHNVEGRVFTENDKSNGAGAGLKVKINDTASGDLVIVYTEDPGPEPLKGIYSATINGNNNDLIIVTSWNATHYGNSNATLSPTTTSIDVVYNLTRASEANVTITEPANQSVVDVGLEFNLSAEIKIIGNDGTSCNAAISFSSNAFSITADQNMTNQLGSISLGSSKATKWNATALSEGNSNITVSAQCSSDGINLEGASRHAVFLTASDLSSPSVSIAHPVNNSWAQPNAAFVYSASDNTGIKNCSLYFDSKLNQTMSNVPLDTEQSFSLNGIAAGQHQWLVSCFDNSTNFNQGNSSSMIVNIDGIIPSVALIAPANNTVMESYSIMFRYNATDNFNVTNCSLILNSQIVQTNYSIIQNITNNFSTTLLGNDYNWSVNCSDNANNAGSSGFFSILTPDYSVAASGIAFSKDAPAENELIIINATIFNIGSANSTSNATVQFFENDPDLNGVQIGNNITINISAGSNMTVSVAYTAKIGRNDIFVVADPPASSNGLIIEKSEGNNKASRQIFISAYHVYYGNIISDIILDASQNSSIFTWQNISSLRGNVFAADSDSAVNFNALLALGRNASSNITFDDFEEIDLALNLTNLTDSINSSYTSNGNAKDAVNFTIFDLDIENIPVVNSTNSSNFVTGIAWDSSDANAGQFDGTQDVVFITKVSKNSVGAYGTYDYEIKVPSSLKRYRSPNEEDTIAFYREIT